jgi:hypothetical protein
MPLQTVLLGRGEALPVNGDGIRLPLNIQTSRSSMQHVSLVPHAIARCGRDLVREVQVLGVRCEV